MIRSIPKISSFGVLSDFRWHAGIPEFKQFNLIYGWNYSGKTTLARAFRCFEEQHHHEDFPDAQVQLKAEDGTVHDLSAPHTALLFRVFNSDFVRDNLIFESGSATPILILGAEDISKQVILKEKRAERDALASTKEVNERKKTEKESEIEKALTNYARDFIKIPLAEVNYDKRRFEPRVSECMTDCQKHLLDDDSLAGCLTLYRSTDKKPTLSSKIVSLASVARLSERATPLLARVVAASNPIPRLKDDAAVEAWVNEGRPLHEGKDACQFCGRVLPADLMKHLSGHFSAAYESLMAKLRTLAESIASAKAEEIALDHRADFYPKLSERFSTEKVKLDKLLEARNQALESLAKALAEKETKAFSSLECPAVDDPAEEIVAAVKAINKIITEHNNRTAEFDRKRQEAFATVEMHYAALFVHEQQHNQQVQLIADLETTIAKQISKLGDLDTDIRALELELSEASKGAERINELLAAYFGKNDDLRVVVSADKRFGIVRGGVVAKNLSEGEKTAIAFAYFITRVEDGRNPVVDTRIVIDDPISSLDAHHLFNTYALIKTQLGGCRQLFILTHSFEFYNLIREWVADDEGRGHAKKPQSDWKKWGVFLLLRADDGKAVLEEIPKELLKFKSEYHYLFSTLYHFDKSGGGDFDRLLSLPNVARRFMEAFGGIMIPLSNPLKGKMERIFPEEVVRERVWKFINHYSHQGTITRSLAIPDTSECKAVVQACLKAVKDWDADYYKDLETEVSQSESRRTTSVHSRG